MMKNKSIKNFASLLGCPLVISFSIKLTDLDCESCQENMYVCNHYCVNFWHLHLFTLFSKILDSLDCLFKIKCKSLKIESFLQTNYIVIAEILFLYQIELTKTVYY